MYDFASKPLHRNPGTVTAPTQVRTVYSTTIGSGNGLQSIIEYQNLEHFSHTPAEIVAIWKILLSIVFVYWKNLFLIRTRRIKKIKSFSPSTITGKINAFVTKKITSRYSSRRTTAYYFIILIHGKP